MILYNRLINELPEGVVHITRPNDWGNPYMIGKHGNRSQVCMLFDHLMRTRMQDPVWVERLRKLSQAPGLACVCSPQQCHGDVIIKYMKEYGFV